MSNARDVLQKIKQRKEDAEAIRAYWNEVLADLGEIPSAQLQSWLGTFDLDTIITGLDRTVIQRSKREAKEKPMDAGQAVRYASAVMHSMRLETLPEHERQAIADRKARISAKRSVAGKVGNEKRWHSEPDVAKVCDDLRSDAMVLRPSYSGSGSCSNSFSSSSSDSNYKGADAPNATALEKEEGKTKPKPTPTPMEVSGVQAKTTPTPKPNPGQRLAQPYRPEPGFTEPHRACKNCGGTLKRDVNHNCAEYEEIDVAVKTGRLNLGTVDDLTGDDGYITTASGLRLKGL
jgi:hypothetical protein